MPREVLERHIEEHLTQREIAAHHGVALATIQHWLKKHGLKTKYGPKGIPRDPSIPRKCVYCSETDPQRFYGRRWNRCKSCDSRINGERGRANKQFARDLLGGKCADCGFSIPITLDIHHTDAAQKDVAFRSMRSWSRARIERELNTCILLCKNCHAIRHYVGAKSVPKEGSRDVSF